MIYCFDTSAINRLHDDPEEKAITTGLLATNSVAVTSLNVLEACATADGERRRSLVGLLRRLASGRRPLAAPTDLLRRYVEVYSVRDERIVASIDERHNGIWVVLNSPSEIDDQVRQEVLEWKSDMERTFRETHAAGREDLQRLFDSGVSPPRSAAALIRYYNSQDALLLDVVSPLYQRITGKPLPPHELRQFLTTATPWALYLLGWAQSVYYRGIRATKSGSDFNPGTLDLWFAVYLHLCQVFVTNDKAQRRALRIINVFSSQEQRPQVISFDSFRTRLLIG